jgi:5-methyltetrahydrofolate--homocysteine methyltransferase
MGTGLIALGLDLEREPPEAWNLSRPDAVKGLHRRFLEAGADVVQTNTFGGSRPRLELGGLGDALVSVNRQAVVLARRAGARRVAASLGPTGLDPFAEGAAARIEAAYREQVAVLCAAGVDALHFETLCHPVEVAAGVAAARAVAEAMEVIVSATCSLGDLGFQTPYGVPLARMAQAGIDAGADALGLNCSLEARKLLGAVRALRELTDLPLLVQPQGGEPSPRLSTDRKGERPGDTPERFAGDAARLVEEGADAIGGCCGATPEHIAALRARLARAVR